MNEEQKNWESEGIGTPSKSDGGSSGRGRMNRRTKLRLAIGSGVAVAAITGAGLAYAGSQSDTTDVGAVPEAAVAAPQAPGGDGVAGPPEGIAGGGPGAGAENGEAGPPDAGGPMGAGGPGAGERPGPEDLADIFFTADGEVKQTAVDRFQDMSDQLPDGGQRLAEDIQQAVDSGDLTAAQGQELLAATGLA